MIFCCSRYVVTPIATKKKRKKKRKDIVQLEGDMTKRVGATNPEKK